MRGDKSGLKLNVMAHAHNLSTWEARQDDRHQTEANLGYVAKFRTVRLLEDFLSKQKDSLAWTRCNPSTGEVQRGTKFKVILDYILSLRLS